MSSTTPTPISESVFQKIWGWIKKEANVVEADLAKVLGSKAAADVEAAGKALLDSDLGPLVTAAIQDATDVTNGQMSVSKAIDNLIQLAATAGKAISKSAALQLIGLLQNTVKVGSTGAAVTPVA
jgi:hypothetical protein